MLRDLIGSTKFNVHMDCSNTIVGFSCFTRDLSSLETCTNSALNKCTLSKLQIVHLDKYYFVCNLLVKNVILIFITNCKYIVTLIFCFFAHL